MKTEFYTLKENIHNSKTVNKQENIKNKTCT